MRPLLRLTSAGVTVGISDRKDEVACNGVGVGLNVCKENEPEGVMVGISNDGTDDGMCGGFGTSEGSRVGCVVGAYNNCRQLSNVVPAVVCSMTCGLHSVAHGL